MKIEQFPTKEAVLKSIDKLNKMSFPKFKNGDDVNEFVEQISNILLDEFGFILSPKQVFNTNEFLSSFFRVRELDSFTNIDLIREHSYPPIDFVRMGRCNFPNFPIFYCSNNPMTALLEVVRDFKRSEKKYCVSKWELIPSNEKMVFENFLQMDLPEDNRLSIIGERIRNHISTPFEESLNKKLDKEQEEGLFEYLKYLDNSFIRDNDYSLSATLAHKSLYVNHNYRTDVLMYPSVQTLSKGMNLAIQPNFVENNLKLTRLYVLNFEKYNSMNGKVSVTLSKYAEVEKNVVMWENIKPKDEKYNKLIKEDFGDFLNSQFIEKKK